MDISRNFAEIERKFLFKGDVEPSSLAIKIIEVQRMYLYVNSGVELRIQKRDSKRYELERKVSDSQSRLVRWSMKTDITSGEFERLQKCMIGEIISYRKIITAYSKISIKEYANQLAPLIIVEVEFDSLEDAQNFIPSQSWIGAEITDYVYSRDSGLIYISDFKELSTQLPTV